MKAHRSIVRPFGGWLGGFLFVVAGFAVGVQVPRAGAPTPERGERDQQVDDRGPAPRARAGGDDFTPVRSTGYSFISPLLECEPGSTRWKGDLASVEAELHTAVDRALHDRRVEHVSVYFRDLTNGPWFGINEQERFTPASLLKVPIMMAWFYLAEVRPDMLDQLVVFERSDSGAVPTIPGSSKLQPGTAYAIGELIERMIISSDNDAAQVLLETVDERVLVRTYAELGFPVPTETDPDPEMTVKQYAAAFRVLFNATLLNRPWSERALETLSHSEFRDGLVAGLPEGLPIAHKFGERSIYGSAGRQLHECGIVYVPGRPYLLCVMTRGENVPAQAALIAELSRAAYATVAGAAPAR